MSMAKVAFIFVTAPISDDFCISYFFDLPLIEV